VVAGPHTLKPTLKTPFTPAVKASLYVRAALSDPVSAARYAQVVADALAMTKGELQRTYQAEYNSLRSRRQQAKARHIPYSDSLKDIRDWLIHLGPRPGKGFTVDRVKPGKGYRPGNLRWATKLEQTQNRKVTKWHSLPTGERLTTKQLAVRHNMSYSAVYKRLQRGWTIERLLHLATPAGLEAWRFPPDLAKHCEKLYRQRKVYKQHRIDWFITYLYEVMYEKPSVKWYKEGDAIVILGRAAEQARKDRARILQQEKERDGAHISELLGIARSIASSADKGQSD
jgi:hypothetical protein